MRQHPLSIIQIEHPHKQRENPSSKLRKKEETEAHFEKLWEENPKLFDPLRNAKERERLKRSMDLLEEPFIKDKHVVDLGCGEAVFAKRILEKEPFHVTCIDAASFPLKRIMEEPRLKAERGCVPNLLLDDDSFDLVVSLELLAYLKPDDYRLFFAEIARLMKKEAIAIISTPIDFRSYDALYRFLHLAETELRIKKITLSHFSLYIKLKDFFKAPKRFYKASQNPQIREKALRERQGFLKKWFRLNSAKLIAPFWKLISFAANPIAYSIDQSRSLLLTMEKFSKFFNNDNSISHAILLAKKKPLISEEEHLKAPIERPGKRQVWE